MSALFADIAGPGLRWLLVTSAQATLLALAILLLRRLFRNRLAARAGYALWLLLLVRLLLPATPQTPFSLFNWFDLPLLAGFDVPATAPVSENLPAAGPAVDPLHSGDSTSAATATPVSTTARLPWPTWIGLIWAGITLLLLLRMLVLTLHMLRHARHTRPLVDQKLLDVLENSKSELGVSVPLNLIVSDRVQSPALLGFLRPRLLLPASLLRALSPAEMRHIFLHEVAHIRRYDIAVSWLIAVLQAVHWFNPVLWYAFRAMRQDMEMACDETVLRVAGPKAYGRVMLKVVELASRFDPLPGLAGILEDGAHVRERIRRLSRPSPHSRGSALLAAGLALLLAGTLLTAAGPPPVQVLAAFERAYAAQDRDALAALLTDDARFVELGWNGAVLARLERPEMLQMWQASWAYNARFTFTDVVASGDTLRFRGAFRSGLFEVVGLYEMEGAGQFVLRDGRIAAVTWQEHGSLKQQRLQVFNDFINWLKYERFADYQRLFGSDLFLQHRASGDEVNRLFFEWIAQTVKTNKGEVRVENLPEVKRVTLEQEIIAILKEFYGPYENAPAYITEVQNYLQGKGIPFEQQKVLGIYFGDPQNDPPETLRSLQGPLVDAPHAVEPPHFVYRMKKTEYLLARVSGQPEKVIPAAYLALFNHMGLKKIRAGSSGGHQIVKMENGQVVFEIYLEIDK